MENVIQIGNVTSKGQITIPAKLRKEFSINEDSRILFEKKDDAILIKPIKNDITAIFGMAKKLGIKTIPPEKAEKKVKEIVAREIAQEGQ